VANDREILDLIRLIYECSVDACLWPQFLAAYARAVDAEAASLSVMDAQNRNGNVGASHGIDPYWEKRYAEHYASVNVWLHSTSLFRVPGLITGSEQVIHDAELEKTEFYNDFLRPQNQFYVSGCVLTNEDSVRSFIGALRSKAKGPTPGAGHGSTHELVRHLQTALRLQHRIAGMDVRLEHASSALDLVPGCLIVTDSAGRIIHMNRRAEAFLKSNAGLRAGADGLRAGSPKQTALLRLFIARTASTILANGRHPGGVIEVLRAGAFPLKLQVTPLATSSTARTGRRPAVAIFIADDTPAVQPDAKLLGALLDLSPAEARLTAALARGETIQQYAKAAGVSINTARTLIGRVFAKTGTSRQVELVTLALTRTASLAPEEEPPRALRQA
jgi:DNA-binding CsgD family transcriptional regulator